MTGFALLAVAAMLALGLYGLLVLRNLIKLLIALQLMAKGAILAFVVAGHAGGKPELGQALAVTVIVADTAVAVLGLALAVALRRRLGTLDVGALRVRP
jgi:NADH:ubiquinone oxidoreductase subunit K